MDPQRILDLEARLQTARNAFATEVYAAYLDYAPVQTLGCFDSIRAEVGYCCEDLDAMVLGMRDPEWCA